MLAALIICLKKEKKIKMAFFGVPQKGSFLRLLSNAVPKACGARAIRRIAAWVRLEVGI